jgi:Fe-S-cluster containining protein
MTDARMNANEPPSTSMRTATADLVVAGRKLRLRLNVPDGKTRGIELLPLFQALADTLVEAAADDAEAKGFAISCRKGCGACCRQLVPISDVEAESLRDLVEALPESRRTVIVERFQRARQELGGAGLLDTLYAPERVPAADAQALGDAYFALGLACPFLDDEACSIHAQRPLACREYLVTTPAVHCERPSDENVHRVPMPALVSRAIRRIEEDESRDHEPWIPMILALEWPARDDVARHTGTAMVARAFGFLVGRKIEAPDP